MWIIFILIIVAAAIIAVGIAEHKRKEKAKERARQRREKRMAALEQQKQEHQKAFASDVGPAETEEGQALSESEELFTPAEPEQEIEASSEPQEAETEEEPAAEEEAAEEKRPEPKKKSRSIEKEAARQREESALDILTERYSYIEEDELENKREKRKAVLWIIGVVVLLLLLVLVVYLWLFRPESEPVSQNSANVQAEHQEGTRYTSLAEEPHAVASTDPASQGISWQILTPEGEVSIYQRQGEVHFSTSQPYFSLPGIATFRGNYFRNSSSYGTATLAEKQFGDVVWTQISSALPTADGTDAWTGSGWTGQPLIAQWDSETRQHMNLYEDKKAKDNLIEVIYATLDGFVYFIDLEEGDYTRDPLFLGMAFKGSGALDPRGYPLLYVGSGDYTTEGASPHMYIISLLDGSVLYEYGDADPAATRAWCAFDSSPLVYAEQDLLIWPGENGILYTMQLGTEYDPAAGTIAVNPELTARTVYQTGRSNNDTYWVGYECSASIIDHYIYLSENGGMFFCVDLNTMELVWAQDTQDDSNSSPVVDFDEQTGRAYIYTAPSLHWTAENGEGPISLYKLDAITGEILWEKTFDCATVEGVSGGVQATPVLGQDGTTLENLVIYPVARTPEPWSGTLIALNTETGEEVWSLAMDYFCWSSPVAVYTEDGSGYLIQFDSQGYGFLIDGATGTVLSEMEVGSPVEATPVVYGNRMVLGTRGQQILGVDLR